MVKKNNPLHPGKFTFGGLENTFSFSTWGIDSFWGALKRRGHFFGGATKKSWSIIIPCILEARDYNYPPWNSHFSHLKNGWLKDDPFLFGAWPIFRGELVASFREGTAQLFLVNGIHLLQKDPQDPQGQAPDPAKKMELLITPRTVGFISAQLTHGILRACIRG